MDEIRQNPDYLRIPNYADALSVTTVDASSLSSRDFLSDFVNRNRPCLIKGAATHWPACTSWQSLDYLKARCGAASLTLHDAPVIEADPLLSSPDKKAWLKMLRLIRRPREIRFAEFLDQAVSEAGDANSLLFLYSVPLGPGGPLEALGKDISTYPFLTDMRSAAFATYPRNNVFFYRSSLTDWHYHATAEALQTQVLGMKEVLLLPPSQLVWSYMFALQSKGLHLYDADLSEFPQSLQVFPVRAVLHPGDALYIPSYWWHLVSTRGNRSLGATVPTWWRSPLHIQCDLRFPATRATVRALLRGALPWWQTAFLITALATGSAWSVARGLVKPVDDVNR